MSHAAAPLEQRVESTMEMRPSSDGGEISYDGVCYDYIDEKAYHGIKLWMPPAPYQARAIMLFGNPGGTGDTRGRCLERSWQEFAMRFGFALAGVTCFPGRDIFDETGQIILSFFDQCADFGLHPGLKHMPLVPRGSSNAGITAFGMACLAPHRCVCFTSNVGVYYGAFDKADPAVLQVPGQQHIGPHDAFMPLGLKTTAELYERIRDQKPLWSWDAEMQKGHQDFNQVHLDFAFYNDIIDRRIPADADPVAGPVILNPIDYNSGYLADASTWDSGRRGLKTPCTVAAHDAFQGDPRQVVWLAGSASARAYQAAATYRRSAQIRIIGESQAFEADGQWNIQDKDICVVDPGTEIQLEIVPYVPNAKAEHALPAYEKIEVFNGDELAAEITTPDARCAITIGLENRVHVFTAIIHCTDGGKEVCGCASAVVRDLAMSAAVEQQMATLRAAFPASDEAAGASIQAVETTTQETDLPSMPLTAEQEEEFASSSLSAVGKIALFWQQCPLLQIDERHARQGSATMSVQSAYSRSGLYLLFTVSDVTDACIDIHIARSAPEDLNSPNRGDHYVRQDCDLLKSECQYQSAFATDELSRCHPMPVHMHGSSITQSLQDLQNEYGIIIRQVQQQQEWFLPWHYVGKPGLWQQPVTGSRLNCVLGLDTASASLRWPFTNDPWSGTHADKCFGSILLSTGQ